MSTPDSGDPSTCPRTRILLVEDNDAASRGLAKILLTLGYEVAVVNDGTAALSFLQEPPPPHFVLTDLRLPDLDGREVSRFASQLDPRPRIALITGWDLEAEPQETLAWGIDWIFSKPLNLNDLISKLREAVEE